MTLGGKKERGMDNIDYEQKPKRLTTSILPAIKS